MTKKKKIIKINKFVIKINSSVKVIPLIYIDIKIFTLWCLSNDDNDNTNNNKLRNRFR